MRIVFFILCCFIFSTGFARTFPEYSVKAVFLFRFIDFVIWPNNKDEKNAIKKICVFGKNPFENYLQEIVDENTQDDSVFIYYLQDLKDIPACHIIFISRSEKHRLSNIINFLKFRPVLTVSDIPNFTSEKGMIEFVIRDKKVRLVVNLKAVNATNIKLSSNLIEIATVVSENNNKEIHQ